MRKIYRISQENKLDFFIYVGYYICRICLRKDSGRFSNGSKWWSGWEDRRKQDYL